MIGTVDHLDYDGDRVLKVVLRFPSRTHLSGEDVKVITTCERLGQGSFGTVYRALCDDYPQLALKISTGKGTRLRQELDVLSKTCTKGKLLLPRFEFGALNQAADLIVIGMELCVPQTMHDLLTTQSLTRESDMLFLAYQAALAVSYVHEEGCIHRDVKLQNFVFDLDGNTKLIDFGLSHNSTKPPPGDLVAGTVAFMAPEMANNALYKDRRTSVGAAADVWSLGIVWFSIFTKCNPYQLTTHDLSTPTASLKEDPKGSKTGSCFVSQADAHMRQNKQLLEMVAMGEWRWPERCNLSPDLKRLVEQVLKKNPAERPTVEEILKNTVWERRRRAPPEDVVHFLGVQNDLLCSHDEAHLMQAVKQRSEDISTLPVLINARLFNITETGGLCEEGEWLDPCAATAQQQHRDSIKVITKRGRDVGGGPLMQVYDVRASTRKRGKSIRDLAIVIAEETTKARVGRSRSRKGTGERKGGGTTSALVSRTSSAQREPSGKPRPKVETDTALLEVDELTEEAGLDSRKVDSDKENSNGVVARGNSSPCKRMMVGNDLQERRAESPVGATQKTLKRDDNTLAVSSSASLSFVGPCETALDPDPESVIILEVDANLGSEALYSTPRVKPRAPSQSLLQLGSGPDAKQAPERKQPRVELLKPPTLTLANGKDIPSLRSPTSSRGAFSDILQSPVAGGTSSRAPPIGVLNVPQIAVRGPVDPFLVSPRSAIRRGSAKCAQEVPFAQPPPIVLQDSVDAISVLEAAQRACLASTLLVHHEWLLASFRLTIEEDQQRYFITWLSTQQAKSASHPHKFKEVTTILIRKYQYGFVCDLCDYDFLPVGKVRKKLHFFHCACGRDLCPECYIEYQRKCTCACCGIVHASSCVLRAHLAQMQAENSVKCTQTNKQCFKSMVQPQSHRGKNTTSSRHCKQNEEMDSLPAALQRDFSHQKGKRKESTEAVSMHISIAAIHQEAMDENISELKSPKLERIEHSITEVPDGPWRPFAKLRRELQPIALQPTREEREIFLNGEWIRYFYLFPNLTEGEPFSFVYHIQPGRIGSIFLTSEFPMHSAVFSMLERQFFIVDHVDTVEGKDVTQVTTLVKAKNHPTLSTAFEALQKIVAYDTNLIKQHRSPGTVSVYQAPRNAYSCNGDPFVYVRWFRFSEDRKLSAFLLSNGAVQVFVNNKFELRWIDENRKFLVRCNGGCEIIGNSTFALAPTINHLLYDTFEA